jgi:hypothetical protein
MEMLAVHKNSESTAHEDQRSLVVALGASNLSRGLSRLLQASRSCSSSAFDLVVAAAGQSVYVTQGCGKGRLNGEPGKNGLVLVPNLWRSDH